MEKVERFTRVRYACYATSASMAVVCCMPSVLFMTFKELYGISYALLGLLVVINFGTQLLMDLIFSFFSHKFNLEKTVKVTPIICFVGLLIFAFAPQIFAGNEYVGLAIGTIIFSVSSGLIEVLISPVIAAIPSDNPDKDMSKLHAVYAWGSVAVVVISTLFVLVFSGANWQILAIVFAGVPLLASLLFCKAKLPKLETPQKITGTGGLLFRKELWICVLAIFLGGASECTMSQWCSGYAEAGLGVPKIWGDMIGTALFGVMLGLGRTLYIKYGKKIRPTLFLGAIGTLLCYLVCSILNVQALGLIACALVGFCTAMMWPGSLMIAKEKNPTGGVFTFALMAAGGDLGASVGPQIVGMVADSVSTNTGNLALANSLGLTLDSLGLRAGMLVGAIFPLLAIIVFGIMLKDKKKEK